MQFQTEVLVIGAKRSKGDYEGQAYDSTKVYIQLQMDVSKDDAIGMAGAEYVYGKSGNFEKLKSERFPFKAIATFEIVTNGKTQKQIMHDLKPIKV